MEDNIIECYLPHFLFKVGDLFVCKKVDRTDDGQHHDYPKYFVYKYNQNGFKFDMFGTSYMLDYRKRVFATCAPYGPIEVSPFFHFLTECMLNHETRMITVRFFNNLRKYFLKEVVYKIFIQHMYVTVYEKKLNF